MRPLAIVVLALTIYPRALAAEDPLPSAKPVPDHQVLPLPNCEASFRYRDRELTRYYYAPWLARPFWYPAAGPAGRSLTRIGHPHDPVGHSHHYSIWIAHHKVNEVNFWADRDAGRIVHQRVEWFDDKPDGAVMVTSNLWQAPAPAAKTLMFDRRRAEVRWLGNDEWLMLVDLQLEAPKQEAVTLGETPFGPMSVRMAKTIGVHDGGGRILNSEGHRNEAQAFRKPARWVDYSGPVTDQVRGGIALLDHPGNPSHPTPFHVRDDGWMCASLTFAEAITIEPGKTLRLRYALWAHPGVPTREEIQRQWQAFAKSAAPDLTPPKR